MLGMRVSEVGSAPNPSEGLKLIITVPAMRDPMSRKRTKSLRGIETYRTLLQIGIWLHVGSAPNPSEGLKLDAVRDVDLEQLGSEAHQIPQRD